MAYNTLIMERVTLSKYSEVVKFRLERYESEFKKLDTSVTSAAMGLFLLACGMITDSDTAIFFGAGFMLLGGFSKGAEYGQLVHARQVGEEVRALITDVKGSVVDEGETINQ